MSTLVGSQNNIRKETLRLNKFRGVWVHKTLADLGKKVMLMQETLEQVTKTVMG